MKLKKSPLQLVTFDLIEMELKSIFPEKEKKKINIQDEFDKYEVNLDFIWKRNRENKNLFLVMTKLYINKGDSPMIGYSIFAEGASHFIVESGNEKDESHLIHYSATGIAFQNLRDILKNITQNSTFGEYLLPTLDLRNLVDEKLRLMQQRKSQTGSKSTIKKQPKQNR